MCYLYRRAGLDLSLFCNKIYKNNSTISSLTLAPRGKVERGHTRCTSSPLGPFGPPEEETRVRPVSVQGFVVNRSRQERCDTIIMRLTLLVTQSRFGDKLLRIWVLCPQNGTAALKGLIAFSLPFLYRDSSSTKKKIAYRD